MAKAVKKTAKREEEVIFKTNSNIENSPYVVQTATRGEGFKLFYQGMQMTDIQNLRIFHLPTGQMQVTATFELDSVRLGMSMDVRDAKRSR